MQGQYDGSRCLAWTVLSFGISRYSHDLYQQIGLSVPRFFCIIAFCGAGEEIKGCSRLTYLGRIMMKRLLVISMVLVLMAILLYGCSLKVKTTTYGHYEPQNEVRIIQSGQVIPEDVIRIGSVETGEKGMTPAKDCTYSACIDAIVKEAKKMGGNIVYIVSIKEPSVWGSTCYYVTADVYLQKSKE